MKKIHVVVLRKDIVPALEILRDLGTVHVEHQEELSGYQLEERREEVAMLKQALAILEPFKGKADAAPREAKDWTDIVTDILELSAQAEHHKENISKWEAQIRQWQPWGDFDPKDIQALAARGIYVQLCEVAAGRSNEVPPDVLLEEVGVPSGVQKCLAISRQAVVLPFATIAPPALSLAQMRALREEESSKVQQAQKKIIEDYCYFDGLKKILVERENVLRFDEVQKGMREEQDLALLKGYCPAEVCGEIREKAKQQRWGLLIEDPSEEDTVPTLLRNPRWIEIIKPVFNVINVLPGYREVDISPVFLIFFSLFFGILIGDAGYGFIFLALTAFFQFKLKGRIQDPAPFILTYVLGGAAVVWGLLTGTLFGTILLGQTVKPIVTWLTDSQNIQLFCFTVGVIHLAVAHMWRCIRKWPAFGAWAEIGWVWVLLQAFLLAKAMILQGASDMTVITGALKAMTPGIVLIVIDIVRGPKSQISVGIVLLVFSIISAFTDIVSYVRLFAVGLAGVAVADAFNQMALGIGFNSVTAGILTSLILIVGHVFNIVLCGFGVLVHGLRLNVLEFSGHLGLEWVGFNYEPFKKIKQTSS